jgi:hypothetical protein
MTHAIAALAVAAAWAFETLGDIAYRDRRVGDGVAP